MSSVIPSAPVPSSATAEPTFQNKIVLHTDAADFFGLPETTTRTDLTRAFLKYCTTHGLLDADGQTIHLNKELLELLDLDSRERVTILNLQRFLGALGALYKNTDSQPSIFSTPVLLSDKLSAFLGLPSGSKLSRREVTHAIVGYCKTHGLLGGETGQQIVADAPLRELLGLQPGDYLSILNLQRYLRDLYYKL